MFFFAYCLFLLTTGFDNDWRDVLFQRDGANLGLYGQKLLNARGKFFQDYRELPFDDPPKPPPGVSFSGIYTNNTVLQMEPLRTTIFGNSAANSQVTVLLQSSDYSEHNTVKTDGDGVWKLTLQKPRPAGGNYTLTATCDQCHNTETLYNITFGDVWYCSGQSNMELPVHNTVSRNQTWTRVLNGELRNIRLYQMNNYNIPDTQGPMFVVPKGAGGSWKLVTNDEFMDMSAVCWYFAQELTGLMGDNSIPIGLVDTAVGGSMIEQWNANHTMTGCDLFDPTARDGHGQNVCKDKPSMCGGLYNGLLAPFLTSTIKGMLWYQGENNMHELHGNWNNNTGYGCLFKTALKNWRSDWNKHSGTTDPDFPVGVVTLAQGTDEGGPDMGGFRWAQTLNYGYFPNPECTTCFSAQSYDLGDPWNGKGCWARGNNRCTGYSPLVPFSATVTPFYMGSIHPRVKLEIGRRLATSAYNMFYGGKGPLTGPVLKGCSVKSTGRGGYHFEIEFDQEMMNPHGINNESAHRISVVGDYHRGFPSNYNYGGPLTVNSNGKWIGVALKGMWDDNGKILADYTDPQNAKPMGIRYAWDNPEITCCPGVDTAITPCMPRSCPAYMKYNVTRVPDNIQVGLELGRPINPFWAQIKWKNDTYGECSCFAPQKCDGTSQLAPIVQAAKRGHHQLKQLS